MYGRLYPLESGSYGQSNTAEAQCHQRIALYPGSSLLQGERLQLERLSRLNSSGCILVDSGEAQRDVDHPSWVRTFVTPPGRLMGSMRRFVVVTGLSALVAWVLARLFKLKRSQT